MAPGVLDHGGLCNGCTLTHPHHHSSPLTLQHSLSRSSRKKRWCVCVCASVNLSCQPALSRWGYFHVERQTCITCKHTACSLVWADHVDTRSAAVHRFTSCCVASRDIWLVIKRHPCRAPNPWEHDTNGYKSKSSHLSCVNHSYSGKNKNWTHLFFGNKQISNGTDDLKVKWYQHKKFIKQNTLNYL